LSDRVIAAPTRVRRADLEVLGPIRHQAPPQYVEAAFFGLGIVPDHRQRIGRCNVPARREVTGLRTRSGMMNGVGDLSSPLNAGRFDVGTGVRTTLRWREVDSNIRYRGIRRRSGRLGVSITSTFLSREIRKRRHEAAYLSSHTSSRRLPLKMLVTMIVSPLT